MEGGFLHAEDLVRYIREEFGDFFGVCVAGMFSLPFIILLFLFLFLLL